MPLADEESRDDTDAEMQDRDSMREVKLVARNPLGSKIYLRKSHSSDPSSRADCSC